jgi:MoxR-like ATPase
VQTKVPQAPAQLAQEVTTFVQELRQADLYKIPGVAETLDWTAALVALDQHALTLDIVADTLGVILKYQDDIGRVNGQTAQQILDRIRL